MRPNPVSKRQGWRHRVRVEKQGTAVPVKAPQDERSGSEQPAVPYQAGP